MSGGPLRGQRATLAKTEKNIKNRPKPKTLTTRAKAKQQGIGLETDQFYCFLHIFYWLSCGIVSQTEKTDTEQKEKNPNWRPRLPCAKEKNPNK